MLKELLKELIREEITGKEAVKQVECSSRDNDGKFKIAILQRGWVFVGNYFCDGQECRLEDAKCIRSWGTTKGLGEIALNGPTAKTILEDHRTVRWPKGVEVCLIDCVGEKWKK